MRRELKYLVHETDRERLYERLAPYVESDAHARGDGLPGYTVRSIYFDTPDLVDYHQKESGDLMRQKLRIRAYDEPEDGQPVFLEVKRKHGQAVWKNRAAVPRGSVHTLLATRRPEGLLPESEREAAGYFLYRLRREARRPTLLVTYDREPFVGRFDPSLRITFDRRLRCEAYPSIGADLQGLLAEQRLRPVLPGYFILEVKYDRVFPSWLRSPLAELRLKRQALSKYGLGLAHEAEK